MAYAFAPSTQDVAAAPTGAPVASTTTPALNTAFTVTASYNDDLPAGSAIFTATKSAPVGSITGCVLTANSDGQSTVIANTAASDTCTVGDDLDTTSDPSTISVTYTCTAAGTVTFTLIEGGSNSGSTVVTCGSGTTTGGVVLAFSYSNQGNCAVQVQATVAGAPDGTIVTFSSGQGILTPSQAPTAGGFAYTLFTPTISYAAATINATTSTGATGTNVVQNTCVAGGYPGGIGYPPIVQQPVVQQPVTQAPVTQPVVQQPVTQAPPAIVLPPQGPISPPNTGDAGLKVDD